MTSAAPPGPMRIDGGIVVGHDGSGGAQTALRWAANLAVGMAAPVHVVRAWQLATAPRPETWEAGYVPPIDDF